MTASEARRTLPPWVMMAPILCVGQTALGRRAGAIIAAPGGFCAERSSVMAAEALELRVTRLEKRVRETTLLLEKTTVLLERLVSEADPEYAERQEADRAWAAFIDARTDLKVSRWRNGDITLYGPEEWFWRDHAVLVETLRLALKRHPEGATARDVLVARWGPDAELELAQAIGSALWSLSRKGRVTRIAGKPCRWTIDEGGRDRGVDPSA